MLVVGHCGLRLSGLLAPLHLAGSGCGKTTARCGPERAGNGTEPAGKGRSPGRIPAEAAAGVGRQQQAGAQGRRDETTGRRDETTGRRDETREGQERAQGGRAEVRGQSKRPGRTSAGRGFCVCSCCCCLWFAALPCVFSCLQVLRRHGGHSASRMRQTATYSEAITKSCTGRQLRLDSSWVT